MAEVWRSTRNIRLSIQNRVGDSINVNSVSPSGVPINFDAPIYWNYYWADPEGQRDLEASEVDRFYAATFLSYGAGRGGVTQLQIDCYSKLGKEGDGDPMGLICADMSDYLQDYFFGAFGGRTYCVEIQDWSDPLNPSPTKAHVFLKSPGKPFGMPAEIGDIRVENYYQRITIRLDFQHVFDLIPGKVHRSVDTA